MGAYWRVGVFLLFAVSRMTGQPAALRAYFSGEAADPLRAADPIFYDEAKYRPYLLGLLQDKNFGPRARGLLILIGYAEDLRKIVSIGVSPDEVYDVATALLAPSTEMEWAFLGRAAVLEHADGWPKKGAIQTLRLLAAPRARLILKEALEDESFAPVVFGDVSLARLASTVAHTVDVGLVQEIGEPRFNRGRDKALIDFTFQAGRDRLIYAATFHRVGGVWRLRGVREMMQYLVAPNPPYDRVQKQP